MNTTTKEFLAVLSVLALLAIVSTISHSDEQQSENAYCENVAMWESSDEPKVERPGHPDYDGRGCDE